MSIFWCFRVKMCRLWSFLLLDVKLHFSQQYFWSFSRIFCSKKLYIFEHEKTPKWTHTMSPKIFMLTQFAWYFWDSLHLHQKRKNAFFSTKKSSHFSKMDIYFCPFFESASISFSDFYFLWDIKSGSLFTARCSDLDDMIMVWNHEWFWEM